MTRKLLYLVNPISGDGKKKLLRTSITQKTKEAGIPFEITDTKADGDYSYLRTKISEEKFTDVIICGGDGSVSTVTACLLNMHINIGIIPMGSGNGLALAAGIPTAVNKALAVIFNGYSSFTDGFYINGKFSCMMCGIGSDAQVAHDFSKQTSRGLKTYLRLSALHYFTSRPHRFTIETKEKKFVTEAFFIVIANSNQFGNNVTIAPRASLNDGLFDVVIVQKMNKLVLPFALLHQISGINTMQEMNAYRKNKNITYFQSSELRIINHDGALIHIDGEPEPACDIVDLKIIPNAFRLLQPSS